MRRLVASLTLVLLFIGTAYLAAPLRDHDPSNRPPSDAMASLHFLHRSRAYPGEELPAEAWGRAFEETAERLRWARAASADYPEPGPWQAIGPQNLGGRTIALAVDPVDPGTLWAGSASGGLWRSDSAGAGSDAWEYVETGFPVLGVNAIAAWDAGGTTGLFIGTGEVYGRDSSIGGLYIRTTRGSYGIGILKSTDGGVTWSKSLDWSYDQRRGVLDLAVDPTDPDRVYAGTTEGVFRTTDGGADWSLVHPEPMAVDLLVSSTGDTVLASHGNLGVPGDAGIWRSTDGGASWTEMTSGLPADWSGKTLLDASPAVYGVLYADVANAFDGVGLYRSLDWGATWECLTDAFAAYRDIATYQGWFSHFVVAHPADTSRVMVAGVDVFVSWTGGRTFQQRSYWWKWYQGILPPDGPSGPPDYSHADHHAFARHPSDPGRVFLANDGGVFETPDFGMTYAARVGGYQTAQFYAGFSSSHLDGDLAAGGLQDNSTMVYHGTTDWERTLGGDGGAAGIDPFDPLRIIASTQYGRLWKSTYTVSGIRQWERVNEEMENSRDVAFVAPFVQAPSDRRVAYAGRERVWRTSDWGDTWRLPGSTAVLDGNPVLSIAIFPLDPDRLWAATVPAAQRAGVYRSSDGARSWVPVTGDLPDRYPVDIVADYSDPMTAYVVFSGFGTGHLFRTRDGGASWEDISGGLPDIPTSAMVLDPGHPDYLYIGNDFGVWFSPDGGSTWAPFTTGMPTAALVMDLSVCPPTGSLRAVTHGNGVWERALVSTEEQAGDTDTPSGTRLMQNLPNPFNHATAIPFYLAEAGQVCIELYDVRGRRLRVLTDGYREAGHHHVSMQAGDLPSGIYLYRLTMDGRSETRRMLLIK